MVQFHWSLEEVSSSFDSSQNPFIKPHLFGTFFSPRIFSYVLVSNGLVNGPSARHISGTIFFSAMEIERQYYKRGCRTIIIFFSVTKTVRHSTTKGNVDLQLIIMIFFSRESVSDVKGHRKTII